MRLKQLKTIGLAVNRGAENGYRILIGIIRYWKANGRCDLFALPDDPQEWTGLLAWHRCAGVIVEANSKERIAAAHGLPVPVVNVSTRLDTPELVRATTDDRAIGAMAAEYLLERGFRHFGFFGMPGTQFSLNRQEGFVATVRKAGYLCACVPDDVMADAEHRLPDWVATLDKPVAFFASNDNRGWRMIQFCTRAGIRIPEELAVVGCDNDPFDCEISEVPLSSVDPGFENVGYQAARVLHRLIGGRRPPADRVMVPPMCVVVRRSSDFLAMDDPGVARTLKYIHDHAAEPIGVDDVAKAVSISRRSLERRYREALDRAPGDDLRKTRVGLAKQVLIETALPMPLVAERSGFSDAKVFGMAFRRQTGMAPRTFRAQFRT